MHRACRYWLASGTCPYGDSCAFSHSTAPAMPHNALPGVGGMSQSPAFGANLYIPRNQRPCRNVIVYGFCRYAGRGCEFNHDITPAQLAQLQHQHMTSPLPQDGSSSGSGGGPDHRTPSPTPAGMGLHSLPAAAAAAAASSMGPMTTTVWRPQAQQRSSFHQHSVPSFPWPEPGTGMTAVAAVAAAKSRTPPPPPPPPMVTIATTPPSSMAVSAPPPPPPSSSHHEQRPRRTLQSLFVSETLRQELLWREAVVNSRPPQDDPRVKGLPTTVHRYHSLVRLDDQANARPRVSPTLGFPTSAYRCESSADGTMYVLRQVENIKQVSDAGKQMADSWQKLRHPNIVSIRNVFISSEIGDVPSLFVAYDYYPGVETLESRLIGLRAESGVPLQPLPEQFVWGALSQLVGALSTMHTQGLTCRGTLVPSKVLVTCSSSRYRINACGLVDIVAGFDASRGLELLQQDDMASLGRLALVLALQSPSAAHPQSIADSLQRVAANYTQGLSGFISWLLGGSVQRPTAQEAVVLLAPHLLEEASRLCSWSDSLEDELRKELQNGRIVRLLAKIGFIADRLESTNDPSWTGPGDRYLLRLFRDYIFHSDTAFSDLAHIIDSLNKLDVGSAERLVLLSHDEQTAFVVSFAEIKHVLEETFAFLSTTEARH